MINHKTENQQLHFLAAQNNKGFSSTYFTFFWSIFTSLLIVIILSSDYYQKKAQFIALSNHVAHAVADKMIIADSALEGFSAFILSHDDFDHQQTSLFVQNMLQRYPFLYMFEVAGKVEHTQRKQKEAELARIYPDFIIREFDYEVTRQWHASPKAKEYFPIIFQEPYYTDDREIVGLDLYSSNILIEAMRASFINGVPIASRPFKLAEGSYGYVIHKALDQKSDDQLTFSLTAKQYTLIVVEIEKLFLGILKNKPKSFLVALSHSRYAPKESGDSVIYSQKNEMMEKGNVSLFPKLSLQKSLAEFVPSQPFLLNSSYQLYWQDFSYWKVFFVLLVAFTFPFLGKNFFDKSFYRKLENMTTHGKLYHMANFDALTGISNRYRLEEHLENSIAAASRANESFSLFFIDISKFKFINDTYGHAAGDSVLIEVGKRLTEQLRHDEMLSRYGGDEFILVSNRAISIDYEDRVIARLKSAFVKPVENENIEIIVKINIGYAVYPNDADDVSSLLAIADNRMYLDKTDLNLQKGN